MMMMMVMTIMMIMIMMMVMKMMIMMIMIMMMMMLLFHHLTWKCWKKAWLHMCSGMYLGCVSDRTSSGRTRVAFHNVCDIDPASPE
jgi:hypothetical protein